MIRFEKNTSLEMLSGDFLTAKVLTGITGDS
jgi:hypothetical protein